MVAALCKARISADAHKACGRAVVQGKTQGACTIRQFRDWMRAMRGDPGLAEEYRQFSEVSAWRVRAPHAA